jgi:hypothetical protein
MGARLHDDSGRLERGRDIRGAAERAVLAGDGGNLSCAVEAILDRQYDGVSTDQRRDQWQRSVVVVRLDRHDHDIDRTHACRRGLGG